MSLLKTYTGVDPTHRPHGMKALVRWGILDRLTGERRVSPPGPGAPRVEPDLDLVHRTGSEPRLTWIGHASFFCNLAGARFLIDPNFSRRVGGFYPRYVAPGLLPEDLPPVDLLLITHSHPDHLDAPSIRRLDRATRVVVPAGLGRWFSRRGFRDVDELRWWDAVDVGPLKVTLTPARHWSRRSPWDENRTLWGGFVIEGSGWAIYNAGDSAWFDGFREIGQRFPGLDVAMVPIGAYAPPWFMEHNHMNPEQAGRAFLEVGARHFVPMHWGTFQLADESLSEPAERIAEWWRTHAPDGKQLHLMAVGDTLTPEGWPKPRAKGSGFSGQGSDMDGLGQKAQPKAGISGAGGPNDRNP